MTLPLAVAAQTAAPTPETANGNSATLPTVGIKVSADTDNETRYKTDKSANTKYTQPLLDTPKTVQVIGKEVMQEQGAVTLMDALRNTPGITMQLGENGSTSAGDVFYLRGFSTESAIFVDGIRDLGAVTRDVYNIDQVEVVKGSAGSDIGRGAASGYVNLITKLPTAEDRSEGTLTLGTANTKRATADVGRAFGQSSAWRLNVMAQDSDVAGRDDVKNKGYGIAPSVAFGLNTDTRLYVYGQIMHEDNVPDGGIPTIGMKGFYNSNASLAAGKRVDRHNYYGSKDDYEKVDAQMVTVKFEHDLDDKTVVRNITRYGQNHMDRVMTGVYTLSANSSTSPDDWTVSRIRQRTDQENEIFTNQTSFTTSFNTLDLKHDLTGGLELIYERQYSLGTGTSAQTINGVTYTAINNPAANLYNPSDDDDLGKPYLTGVNTEGKTTTGALYLADTVTINPAFKVNGGLRFERYHTETSSGTIVTSSNSSTYPGYAVGSVAPASLKDSDNLTSWNVGAVYKPTVDGTVYVSWANSSTPPGSSNFSLSATSTNQANPNMDPQATRSVELGTKWDVLDKRLNLSAAVYRTVNNNQISYDDLGNAVQEGKLTVQGLELGAVGQVTRDWQVSSGLAWMDPHQDNQWNSTHTTETTGVRWSPRFTATFWTAYDWGDFSLGGGASYVGKQKLTITAGTDLSTTNMPQIGAYWVASLMGSYKVNRNVKLQLNVANLFDRDYISSLNNSGARAKLGTPRTVQLTAAVQF